jgi:antitoxin (DNA-binding transcriptional repressor) of toxin-antitoxin stability system
VEATNKHRELRRDNKPVALLTPIGENQEKWKKDKSGLWKLERP